MLFFCSFEIFIGYCCGCSFPSVNFLAYSLFKVIPHSYSYRHTEGDRSTWPSRFHLSSATSIDNELATVNSHSFCLLSYEALDCLLLFSAHF